MNNIGHWIRRTQSDNRELWTEPLIINSERANYDYKYANTNDSLSTSDCNLCCQEIKKCKYLKVLRRWLKHESYQPFQGRRETTITFRTTIKRAIEERIIEIELERGMRVKIYEPEI